MDHSPRLNKKNGSFRITNGNIATQPKSFYKRNLADINKQKNTLRRANQTIKQKNNKDTVGQMFKSFEIRDRLNQEKRRRDLERKNMYKGRIEFEEKFEREEMKEMMRKKKLEKSRLKLEQERAKDFENWQIKRCGHCHKYKYKKLNNVQTQTPKRGRFASKSFEKKRVHLADEIESQDEENEVRDKRVHFEKKRSLSIRSIHSKRSIVSRKKRNFSRDNKHEEIQNKLLTSNFGHSDCENRVEDTQHKFYLRRKRRFSATGGERRQERELDVSRNWEMMQSETVYDRFYDRFEDLDEGNDARVVQLMNDAMNKQMVQEKKRREKKRKEEEREWVRGIMREEEEKEQMNDRFEQMKRDYWKGEVRRQLHDKERKIRRHEDEKEEIRWNMKRTGELNKMKERMARQREEVKRREYQLGLAQQRMKDQQIKINNKYLSIEESRMASNVLIDDVNRTKHRQKVRQNSQRLIQRERLENEKKRLGDIETEKMEKKENQRFLEDEEEREKRLKEEKKRKERKLLLEQYQEHERQKERKRELKKQRDKEELYYIRRKERLDQEREELNQVRKKMDQEEYFKSLNDQLEWNKFKKWKEQKEEEENLHFGLHTTGDKRRLIERNMIKGWTRTLGNRRNRSLF